MGNYKHYHLSELSWTALKLGSRIRFPVNVWTYIRVFLWMQERWPDPPSKELGWISNRWNETQPSLSLCETLEDELTQRKKNRKELQKQHSVYVITKVFDLKCPGLKVPKLESSENIMAVWRVSAVPTPSLIRPRISRADCSHLQLPLFFRSLWHRNTS
jgi:hypothetical protein